MKLKQFINDLCTIDSIIDRLIFMFEIGYLHLELDGEPFIMLKDRDDGIMLSIDEYEFLKERFEETLNEQKIS